MRHVDSILRARWIIPVDSTEQVLEHHAIILDCGKILDIIPTQDVNSLYTATHDTYFDHHAILPGFINAHTHIGMNMLRSMSSDLPLLEWLKRSIWPLENLIISEDYVEAASLSALGEMIKGGTTCINDMYYYAEQTAKSAAKAGIRATLSETLTAVRSPISASVDDCWLRTIQLFDSIESLDNPLIRAAFGPHASFTTNQRILTDIAAKASQNRLGIHMHVHSSQAGVDQFIQKNRKRPLAYLNELGLCSPKLQAVHMTQVNEKDIAILKNTGTSVIHCPESNIQLNSGVSPVKRFLEEGINVALGTDSVASNHDLDMLSEMRTACYLDRIFQQKHETLTPKQALKMATINGAKALGIDTITGSLEKGKSADIIAINLNQIGTTPTFDPISQLVYAANSHQVTDVWVAGKALMKNRTLTTLNESALLNMNNQWQEKLDKAALQLGL